MDAADKRMLEREALRNMIQQWNAYRIDLFELSEPNENLEFHGVMRFYFQDSGQKIATKCIRVASDATVSDVIETLIEKFRPDMRMLSLGSYSLWETHGPDDERQLEPHEKPLLVQLNWHADDREGRFLLKCTSNTEMGLSSISEKGDQNFKRKLSKREKKELKKKEKLSRLKSDANDENRPATEKLYTELPETSFTRSISNPEAVMRRRRQQKLERKLQQFRSKDGGPDTGGTLKIYGSSLCPDVPYKTLLLSIGDTAAAIAREMLDKYGLSRHDPYQYCIVQVNAADNSEYVLEDDECPLAIVMTHPHRSSIMFHVRRRPADSQPRRRKKKVGGIANAGAGGGRPGNEPVLVEVAPDGSPLENGRRIRVTDVVEVGSGNGMSLQLYGPSIQPRHCVVASADGGGAGGAYSVTPLHTDAQVYLNGQRIMHSARLQHGCLLKFGRVSTFRFVDPTQENLLNRNLSQSQHFGSGTIYDRSTAAGGADAGSGAMSPASLHDLDHTNANTTDTDYQRTMSPVSHDAYGYGRDPSDNVTPYNNNTLKLDNESLIMSQHFNDSKDDYIRDEHGGSVYERESRDRQSFVSNRNNSYKDNYETTFDLDGNVETKSISSAKSGGSGHENRVSASASAAAAARPGQEAILPAVLEFPEAGQAQFLAAVVTRLDPHAPAFKLAPVYTLYLCARYRASTHYRPELTPTERAHKLTAFLHHVATLIHATVQERCTDSAAQAFWMANASELLHFLKCDRHISSFSTQAQELLPTTVQNAFSNLVSCFQEELSPALAALTGAAAGGADTEATAPTLQALAAAMVLLRRCRVNAALTIQLFSHLFHYINAVCFNKLVRSTVAVTPAWGAALSSRLALLGAWAERQGLELAADCHLARVHQAARLIQGEYRTPEEVRAALAACFKLNSAQVRALLAPAAAPDVVEAAAAHARALADELYKTDGREISVEESTWLGVGLLIPGDGFSAEVVRGVPPGLAEFVAPLQRGGLCRLAHQPHALGLWTVYMAGYGAALAPHARRPNEPRVQIIQLNKNSNGMGLSIVAAKGAGQSKLGIYIKSVVSGGAAAADGRLAAGDQLLSVDGHSLVGITQEKAAEYLVRTGPTVTLEVAKQGAVLHGLATLLHQPAYNQRPGYGHRSCEDKCRNVQHESSESSSDESEECQPHYHSNSIPRLIITLDHENNQLCEDQSPDTPGCPLELRCSRSQPRPIPIFTFTCEDYDDCHNDGMIRANTEMAHEIREPPGTILSYDQSSESGDTICLPPKMHPIDTNLTLNLFNVHNKDNELYRGRCTAVDECVSACECCRTPQPEAAQIPFIDEPNCEPIIFENDIADCKMFTPKARRILPSLSLDKCDEVKPTTVDAVCQTQPSIQTIDNMNNPEHERHSVKKSDLKLDICNESKKIDNIQCRLKRTLFSMTQSLSNRSEEAEATSYSTSDSYSEYAKNVSYSSKDVGAKQVLDSTDRKSWKSPDEFRPALGTVKALTKHFNKINLRYCVRNFKRNCQSSPNLNIIDDKPMNTKDNLQGSASLADIVYESNKSQTPDVTKSEKLSDDEVKSILIQLEDWSKYGSRGSEDTLAQCSEFELPNLPPEDLAENNSLNSNIIFNEIIDKKPKTITLDSIKLKTITSELKKENNSKESLGGYGSLDELNGSTIPRVVAMIPRRKVTSLFDVSDSKATITKSKREFNSSPNIASSQCQRPHPRAPASPVSSASPGAAAGGARRASERDLPARLAAEPVKPSKSTPALHHLASPPAPHHHHHPAPHHSALQSATNTPPSGMWASGKSRSSHNLSAAASQQPPLMQMISGSHDGFYQNVATVQSQAHTINDNRWPSMRSEAAAGRPQSALLAAAAPAQHNDPMDSPQHQYQMNQSNTMSIRAAKLAEMSEEVSRRQQHQQQMQQQQMQQQYQQQKPPPILPHQHPQQPTHNHQAMHQQPSLHPQMMATQQQMQQQSPHPHMHQQIQSPPPQQMYHNQHLQQQQRYEWQASGAPPTQKVHPPVAPKPQGPRRPEVDNEDQQQASNVQPDDEWYVASAMEPPAVAAYGAAAGGSPRGAPHNPWQREEREREAEARRAAARARRDASIASLVALGAARTPHQDQQLRALQLERDFERRATQHDQEEAIGAESSVVGMSGVDSSENDDEPPTQPPPLPPTAHPPKSILKTNTRSQHDLSNGFVHEQIISEETSRMSNITSGLSGVGLGEAGPPPPPERGSSFAVMAVRARALSPPAPAPASPPAPAPAAQCGPPRDKRVSFHERPPAPPASDPPLRDDPHDHVTSPVPASQREDPDRFLAEAASMLSSPASPGAAAAHAHTPGVIGAQEVYRDPRARRLAAAQQAAARAAPVPEQLSFKEKMKMFALESGEASTPKDKVKISRAQRDIDAVH